MPKIKSSRRAERLALPTNRTNEECREEERRESDEFIERATETPKLVDETSHSSPLSSSLMSHKE